MIVIKVYLVHHVQRLNKSSLCVLYVPTYVNEPGNCNGTLAHYSDDEAADPHVALIVLNSLVSVLVLFIVFIHF